MIDSPNNLPLLQPCNAYFWHREPRAEHIHRTFSARRLSARRKLFGRLAVRRRHCSRLDRPHGWFSGGNNQREHLIYHRFVPISRYLPLLSQKPLAACPRVSRNARSPAAILSPETFSCSSTRRPLSLGF